MIHRTPPISISEFGWVFGSAPSSTTQRQQKINRSMQGSMGDESETVRECDRDACVKDENSLSAFAKTPL